MAEVNKKVNVQFTADVKGLEQGSNQANSLLGGVSKTALAAAATLGGIALSIGTIKAAIDRGQAFTELEDAFDGLYGKSLLLANGGLAKLSTALDGTVRNLDILKTANKAALAQIKPEQFLSIAAAAETLGDKVGAKPVTALNDLTDAFIRGNDRALAAYGLFVDNAKALDDYAAKAGKAKDRLSELEQKEAVRLALQQKIVEVTKSTGEATRTAGDNLERLDIAYENGLDAIGKSINKNEALSKAIGEVADVLKQVDIGPFVTAMGTMVTVAAKSVSAILEIFSTAREGWSFILGTGEAGKASFKISELNLRLAEDAKQLKVIENLSGETYAAIRERLQKHADGLRAERDELIKVQDAQRAATSGADAMAKAQEAVAAAAAGSTASVAKLGAELKKLPAAPEIISAQIIPVLDDSLYKSAVTAGQNFQNELESAFSASVDVFHNLFSSLFSGGGDIEDLLKGLGVDLASTFAASISTSLELDLSGVGSQSPGQIIGGALGGLFGTPSLAPGTSGIGPVANGDVYGKALKGIDWLSLGIGVAQTLLPALTKVFDGIFGGTTNKDTLARRGLRDELKQFFGDDLQVNTVKGKQSLTQVDYANLSNFIKSSPVGNQSVGLATGIGEVLGGGGKLGEDATAIFAQLIGQADNFNEAIINSLSIMDQLGLSASDAKDKLKDLFLDGKVGLDVFGTGIQNLNLLAQNDLVGPNSVADALKVIGDNIKNPRIALKGLELAFKEMADLGIDTSSEVVAYLTDKFGPDIAGVFAQITATGLDTWEEIKNANADQLFAIFQALQGWQSDVTDVFDQTARTIADSFTQAGTDAADGFISGTQPLIDHAKKIDKAWKDTANQVGGYIKDIAQNALDNGGGGKLPKSGGAGSNVVGGNVANNTFRA